MKDIAVKKIKDTADDLINDKKTLVKVLSIALILVLAAVLRIHGVNKADITIESEESVTESSEDLSEEETDDIGKIIFIDIGGAVRNPGVYQVAEGTRLFEVVEMAGGLTEKADTDSVNQAAFIEDGEKIVIPVRGENSAVDTEASSSSVSSGSSALVNINTASKEELKTLKGIGDVMADRILEYRANSRFKKKEDIMSVKGIGSGIFDNIKDSIVV